LLDPPAAWRPDANRGLERLHARDRASVTLRRRWTWTLTTASAACILLLALSAPQACAFGACLKPSAPVSAPPAAVAKVEAPVAVAPPTVAKAEAPKHEPPKISGFKISGSPSAPITLEIYSDYECPYCVRFFDETVPLIVAQYVLTGRVKLVHRDFPLPQHPWARLAARYANAAGELGQYDLAVNQIFQTQNLWRDTGRIDTQLALVLPPGVMQRVRNLVQHDSTLDETVAADLEIAAQDHINQTPSLVVESQRGRVILAPAPSFTVLKNYLDQLPGR
jgi:protein-disulfide isomerase